MVTDRWVGTIRREQVKRFHPACQVLGQQAPNLPAVLVKVFVPSRNGSHGGKPRVERMLTELANSRAVLDVVIDAAGVSEPR